MRPYFFRLTETTDFAVHNDEMLHPSQELAEALNILSKHGSTFGNWEKHLHAPYFKLYYARERARSLANQHLDPDVSQRVHHLVDHIESVAAASHREADLLLLQGLVSRTHLAALFQEGQVMVQDSESGDPMAYVITKSPRGQFSTCEVTGCRIIFDGKFRKRYKTITLRWPLDARGQPLKGTVPITSLNVYPLHYETTGEVEKVLRQRGEIVWGCRERSLLEYSAPTTSFEVQQVRETV